MKLLPVLPLALLAFSCQSPQKESIDWMQIIKEQTKEGNFRIDSTSYAADAPMDTTFLQKFIFDVQADSTKEFRFPAYTHNSYYWGERYQEDSLLVFTFIFADEYCCRSIYAISSSVTEFKPLDIQEIAITGGDGDWGQNDSGEWLSPLQLKILKTTITREAPEDSSRMAYDSIWTTININSNGIFHSNLDSSVQVLK